jgi:hypothetical protein
MENVFFLKEPHTVSGHFASCLLLWPLLRPVYSLALLRTFRHLRLARLDGTAQRAPYVRVVRKVAHVLHEAAEVHSMPASHHGNICLLAFGGHAPQAHTAQRVTRCGLLMDDICCRRGERSRHCRHCVIFAVTVVDVDEGPYWSEGLRDRPEGFGLLHCIRDVVLGFGVRKEGTCHQVHDGASLLARSRRPCGP